MHRALHFLTLLKYCMHAHRNVKRFTHDTCTLYTHTHAMQPDPSVGDGNNNTNRKYGFRCEFQREFFSIQMLPFIRISVILLSVPPHYIDNISIFHFVYLHTKEIVCFYSLYSDIFVFFFCGIATLYAAYLFQFIIVLPFKMWSHCERGPFLLLPFTCG